MQLHKGKPSAGDGEAGQSGQGAGSRGPQVAAAGPTPPALAAALRSSPLGGIPVFPHGLLGPSRTSVLSPDIRNLKASSKGEMPQGPAQGHKAGGKVWPWG